MKKRCYNEKDICYNIYGGRGIKVCDEWRDSFLNFYNWAVTNNWQPGLEIDRKDTNGNYEPSNCRYVTRKVNANNRRDNVMLTFRGETKTISEWADVTGIPLARLQKRAASGRWDAEKILTQPPRARSGGCCVKGHRLDEENSFIMPDGRVRCNTCSRDNHRLRYLLKKNQSRATN